MTLAKIKIEVNQLGSISPIDAINYLLNKNGPDPEDIELIRSMSYILFNSSDETKLDFHEYMKPILNTDSLLGFTFLKPHGYSGDFQLIDKIHTYEISENIKYKKWDEMYHQLNACIALRNRKKYLNNLLHSELQNKDSITVLNLGSGPGRDIKEFLDLNPDSKIKIDSIDMDSNAIAYAEELNKEHLHKLRFFKRNVFKLKTDDQYDIVWSAGMFDYFNDKFFIRLIKNLFKSVKKDGQLVIGNIDDSNKDRISMEMLGNWKLHHRNADILTSLVEKSKINYSSSEVLSEPTGVNIFVHSKN